jgi:hypothetical protein
MYDITTTESDGGIGVHHLDLVSQVRQEIEYIRNSPNKKVVSIGSTARLLAEFLVLPRRSYTDVDCINFLVSKQEDAAYCMERLDGLVDYVLVDVEAKQNIDLMDIATQFVRISTIVAYKPNDVSVEAADLLIRQHFHDNLSNRQILILGAGNISSKLALRLSERNVSIKLYSRDYEKTKGIVSGLNAILPAFSPKQIEAIEKLPDLEGCFEGVVSFVAADRVANEEIARLISRGGIAIDGGINNFSSGFLSESQQRGITCSRLDVRLGFMYALLSLNQDIARFSFDIKGERLAGDIRLVAGGIIGNRGDVILDRIKDPSQIIGIANGVGGVLNESDYSMDDIRKLKEVQNHIIHTVNVHR